MGGGNGAGGNGAGEIGAGENVASLKLFARGGLRQHGGDVVVTHMTSESKGDVHLGPVAKKKFHLDQIDPDLEIPMFLLSWIR